MSFIAFESAVDQMERANQRLFILNIILITLLLACTVFFFWYESQFEDIKTEHTFTQYLDTGDGGTATINDGIRFYGEDQTDGNGND